uniref:Cyclin D3 n=1 Tax=Callorhinchus milii TaxID=7868 RepID=A0A4W3GJ86_CALMI
MELLCMENAPKVQRAFPDPKLLLDHRVMQNMLQVEDRYTPRTSYFKCVQREIEPYMRKMVAFWMLEVDKKCEHRGTNFSSRHMLSFRCLVLKDKYIKSLDLKTNKLMLANYVTLICSFPQDWEIVVLGKLKWDLSAVTPNDFIEHILGKLAFPVDKLELIKKHTLTFIAMCATDFSFAMYPPSMIATGSIAAAIRGLGISCSSLSDESLTELLAKITCTELDCLKACQEQIEAALAESLKQSQQQQQEQAMSSKTVHEPDQTSTPTDVRDVNL